MPAGPSARRNQFDPRAGQDFSGYKAYTTDYDEVIDAARLCDADELTRLRAQLDQQLSNLQGVVARLANRLQRRLLARQTRAWQFDLEDGLLDSGRLARVVADPMYPAQLQAGAGDRVPRHRGHAADRQLGLDARPAHFGRGDERRHPRPNPGAVRGQGRDPGLHDQGLEGRHGARALGRRRPRQVIRAASTICATSSTRAPTSRGGGRGGVWG